jgi:DNA-directed RNA polymerase subunit RPC12/RpoP
MFLAHSLKCTDCGSEAGAIISPTAHHDALPMLEFICVECAEKIAKSEAVTLDSETSWGKVIARIKGR